jgi:hypothetical protein
MGVYLIKKQSAASVPTPPADQIALFVDSADDVLKTKDSSDVVRPSGVGTATELATVADPVAVDGGGEPNIGDLLVATNDTPPESEWSDPMVVVLSPVRQTAIKSGIIPAVIGELIRVDLTGGDATISLPAIAPTNQDREIWVKIRGAASGNTCTVNPDGTDEIDGAANYILDTDDEWVKLRSDGADPGGPSQWLQVG